MSDQSSISPAEPTTIAAAAAANQDFSILATVVEAASLVDTLASPGPFTVFAPTDAAFAKLPDGAVDRLLRPENRVALTSFVARHILAGRLTATELRERAQANAGHLVLRNVDGDLLEVEPRDDGLHVGGNGAGATVVLNDLLQSNGVIHVTDSVLSLPDR